MSGDPTGHGQITITRPDGTTFTTDIPIMWGKTGDLTMTGRDRQDPADAVQPAPCDVRHTLATLRRRHATTEPDPEGDARSAATSN